jgi:hypothetical protein
VRGESDGIRRRGCLRRVAMEIAGLRRCASDVHDEDVTVLRLCMHPLLRATTSNLSGKLRSMVIFVRRSSNNMVKVPFSFYSGLSLQETQTVGFTGKRQGDRMQQRLAEESICRCLSER